MVKIKLQSVLNQSTTFVLAFSNVRETLEFSKRFSIVENKHREITKKREISKIHQHFKHRIIKDLEILSKS